MSTPLKTNPTFCIACECLMTQFASTVKYLAFSLCFHSIIIVSNSISTKKNPFPSLNVVCIVIPFLPQCRFFFFNFFHSVDINLSVLGKNKFKQTQGSTGDSFSIFHGKESEHWNKAEVSFAEYFCKDSLISSPLFVKELANLNKTLYICLLLQVTNFS